MKMMDKSQMELGERLEMVYDRFKMTFIEIREMM